MAGKRKGAESVPRNRNKKAAKDQARRGEAYFLTIVPLDVQRDIFENWLVGRDDHSGLQQALSALDVACCSAALREPFLALARSLAFSSFCPDENNNNLGVLVPNRMLNYLAWVQDRRIAIKALTLSGKLVKTGMCLRTVTKFLRMRGTLLLPSVEHVFLASDTDAHLLNTVLSICPNVTSIDGKMNLGDILPTVNEHVWRVVSAFPDLKLTRLAGCGEKVLLKALKTFGHCLEHLHLSNPVDAKIVFCITDHCSKLKTLHAHLADNVIVEDIVNMVTACEELVDINFPAFRGSIGDVEAIVAAGRQLKKMDIMSANEPLRASFFLELLDKHPQLEVVGFEDCQYDHSKRFLEINMEQLDLEEISRILTKCAGVTKLNLWWDNDGMDMIVTILGNTLKEVELSGDKELPEEMLLHIPLGCPLLECLTVSAAEAISDYGLRQIGDKCKHLRKFHLCRGFRLWPLRNITDDGMDALFAGCSKLKVVEMTGNVHSPLITFKTLEAIVTRRLHLERFTWGTCSIDDGDEARYHAFAKEQNHLPVPVVMVQQK